jgi:hypothetical protein
LVPALEALKPTPDVLTRALTALLGGAASLLLGQLARALFDQASAARELVAIERAKIGDHR